VVVVPFDRIDEVIARLERVREVEEELDAEVQKGQKVPPSVLDILSGDQTHYVD